MNKKLFNDLNNTLIALKSYLNTGVFILEKKKRIELEIEIVENALKLIQKGIIVNEDQLEDYFDELDI